MAFNFSEQEKRILKFWDEIKAFEGSVARRPKGRPFVFYEGPPTANGKPGIHHAESRAFKDLICRYKTMRGYRVERNAGWDTHGLPVEISVERELGFTNKKDIEAYGIERFNEKCRQSVWRYKKDWEDFTRRIGFWLDMSDPYKTLDPLYIETLWWILGEAWKKKLLYEGHRVVPLCVRCGTSLSSHEVAQGYRDITEQSVFVRFKIKDPTKYNLPSHTSFLVWTTTPWTLPGNVALAVGPRIEYVIAKQGSEHYILAKERLGVLQEDYEIVAQLSPQQLEGIEYEPFFDSLKDTKEHKYFVARGDFVTTEEGTGIVHIAPMYGDDDYQLGLRISLPHVHTVNEDGTFNNRVRSWSGKNAKASDPSITKDLDARGLLYRTMPYKHSYPFCWRCDSPLIYYAMHSWFIRMSALKKELISANKKIAWVPSYIQQGRFGEWLHDVKDWNLSRSRYWGTPLPVWRCGSCSDVSVVGSRLELAHATKGKNRYWVLRHGYAESNNLQILSGTYPERGRRYHVKPEGIRQVQRAIKDIRKQGGVDMIFASPITRTRETAELVARSLGLKVHYEKKLLEVNVGVLEGGPWSAYEDAFGTDVVRFAEAPRGGETLTQVQRRMVSFLDELEKKYEGKKILIISHGDPLLVLEGAMRGLTIAEVTRRRRRNYPKTGQLRRLGYAQFPFNKSGELDFHRPYVDAITFSCEACGGLKKRDEYLVDVWFDSGSMPLAQLHYPFENKERIDSGERYPADFISEAIDQTRGWFYSLLAVSAVLDKLKRGPTFKNVISLGHVLDEKGQKMSKSKGNVVDPMELGGRYGMDAVRWYFYTINGPGDVKRFNERDVRERMQKFIATLWNSYIFFEMYAPSGTKVPKTFRSKHVLDTWMHARLNHVAREVRGHLDDYHVVEAARALDTFVIEDFSNWYIRRSRSRLQRPANASEHQEAARCLAYALNAIVIMSAPFIPFLSEALWQKLHNAKNRGKSVPREPKASRSVHWEDFPHPRILSPKHVRALSDMKNVREWAEAGLRLRAEAGIRVRQPLHSFTVPKKLIGPYRDILKEELNVKEIVEGKELKIDTELTRELVIEGQVREMVRRIQGMRKSVGLRPHHKIRVYYSLPSALQATLDMHEAKIAADTNAIEMRSGKIEGRYDATSSFKWDGKSEVTIAIKKVR